MAFLRNSGKANIVTHTKLPEGPALNFVPGAQTASAAGSPETSAEEGISAALGASCGGRVLNAVLVSEQMT